MLLKHPRQVRSQCQRPRHLVLSDWELLGTDAVSCRLNMASRPWLAKPQHCLSFQGRFYSYAHLHTGGSNQALVPEDPTASLLRATNKGLDGCRRSPCGSDEKNPHADSQDNMHKRRVKLCSS